MKNYKNRNIKLYENSDGDNFDDTKLEKLIRKIVKLAGKLGWKYSQNQLLGKSFCVIGGTKEFPGGKTIKETVRMEFTWRSKKDKV